MMLPDSIHHHTSGQWVLGTGQPIRQGQSAAARIRRYVVTTECGRKVAFDGIASILGIAAFVKLRVVRSSFHHGVRFFDGLFECVSLFLQFISRSDPTSRITQCTSESWSMFDAPGDSVATRGIGICDSSFDGDDHNVCWTLPGDCNTTLWSGMKSERPLEAKVTVMNLTPASFEFTKADGQSAAPRWMYRPFVFSPSRMNSVSKVGRWNKIKK